jgi:hypothetical protein
LTTSSHENLREIGAADDRGGIGQPRPAQLGQVMPSAAPTSPRSSQMQTVDRGRAVGERPRHVMPAIIGHATNTPSENC